MIRIGILGDIGSGKSFVAKTFGYHYPGGVVLDKIASETSEFEVEAPAVTASSLTSKSFKLLRKLFSNNRTKLDSSRSDHY